jgi:serine/threonine protein kinase
MRVIAREPSRTGGYFVANPRVSTVWQRNGSPERAPRHSQVIGGLTPLRGIKQRIMPSPGIPAGARAQTPRPCPPGRALTTPRTVQQSESTARLNEAPSPIPSAWASEFQINSEAPSLGGGAFAEVYRVEHKKSHVQYAIKVMHWPNFHLRGIEAQIEAEIRAMQLAAEGWKSGEENHIVRMLKSTEEGEYVFVLLELCGQGDILRQLSSQPSGKFAEQQAASWALHLFLGLKNIHSLGVIHRDIKPDNLLCCDDHLRTLKIADFGWCAERKDKPTALAGTFQYMAPEVLRNQPQTEAVDVWSAGATLYQLMTGRALLQTYLGPGATQLSSTNPHEATRIKQSWLVREIEDTCPPHVENRPDDLSNQCWDFLRCILEPKVQRRATVEEALRHPWLVNVTPTSAPPSLEPSPEPAIAMSPDRRSCCSVESVENVPTPAKDRSYVEGRNNAYSPPVDKSKGSPGSKRSLSASPQSSPRRDIASPLPALAGRGRTPRAYEAHRLSTLETSSRSVPPIVRRNSGRESIIHEVTPFELESRLGRASSLSNVQSMSTRELCTMVQECSHNCMKLHSALESLQDGPTTRPAYVYDSLLATAPSLPCDRTRSPGPSKARNGEVFTPSVRKGDTSPIRVHEVRRSNWQPDSSTRRPAVPAQTVSTWLYTSGYPMDVLSKSVNPRNATAAAPRECRTPMVPLHPLGLRDFNVPAQSVLVHQSNQTLGHQTVTYRQDVHWQPSTLQQPAQRIHRRRETLGGAWPPPQVARY